MVARTRLSTKGQVIIPKAVRDRQGWRAGTELEVEEHGEAVVLRARHVFPPTRFEDVRGCLGYRGRRLSLAEMDEAVRAEARRRR